MGSGPAPFEIVIGSSLLVPPTDGEPDPIVPGHGSPRDAIKTCRRINPGVGWVGRMGARNGDGQGERRGGGGVPAQSTNGWVEEALPTHWVPKLPTLCTPSSMYFPLRNTSFPIMADLSKGAGAGVGRVGKAHNVCWQRPPKKTAVGGWGASGAHIQ